MSGEAVKRRRGCSDVLVLLSACQHICRVTQDRLQEEWSWLWRTQKSGQYGVNALVLIFKCSSFRAETLCFTWTFGLKVVYPTEQGPNIRTCSPRTKSFYILPTSFKQVKMKDSLYILIFVLFIFPLFFISLLQMEKLPHAEIIWMKSFEVFGALRTAF